MAIGGEGRGEGARSRVERLTFSGPEPLAEAAAQRWLAELGRARGGRTVCVALSGGRIAKAFFQAIVGRLRAEGGGARVHFFWADERCVPPSDQESNFGVAREVLLAPLQVPENRVHRVRGEDPPEQAARAAEAELRQFAPPDSAGRPVLDWIFLGMGEDGHVASLFPGSEEDDFGREEGGGKREERRTRVYVPVVGPKPPPNRVTLTYEAIAAAREVWVLVSGPGKRTALQESLEPNGKTPLAQVLRLRERTVIFEDTGIERK